MNWHSFPIQFFLINIITDVGLSGKVSSEKEDLLVKELSSLGSPTSHEFFKDMIFYVYVLQSEMDGMFYTGFTTDLKRRVSEHNGGKAVATCWRRPLKLIYTEICFNREDALRRETYLKSGNGKIYLQKRLRNYLSGTRIIHLNTELELIKTDIYDNTN